MKVQHDIPARVNAWLARVKKADGSPEDRDARPDFVQLQGTPDFHEDRLLSARAQFDARGTASAKLVVDAHEHPFYSNEWTVQVRREGDQELVLVRSHHPTDPAVFDYRASYARDLNSGEVKDFVLRPGPPQGLELAHEIFTNRECQGNLVAGAALGTLSGAATSLFTGLAPGSGALIGLALGTLAGYAFSMQQRAYGG